MKDIMDPNVAARVARLERAYNRAGRGGALERREAIWAALRRLWGWK